MSDQPLDAASIQGYIAEVADELEPGSQRILVIVGGALLAWHGYRATTGDVDSVQRLDRDVKDAVARVAARHDLAPAWLNDSAARFAPATFRLEDCEVLSNTPTLRVLGAPMDQIFVMKLMASRAVDTDDLEAIWRDCTFGSPEEAAEAFFNAYPFEERDPFLADRIREIVQS